MKVQTKIALTLMHYLFLSTGHASIEELKIAYNQVPNPPYNMGNHSSTLPGISIELIRKATEEVGIKASFTAVPWKRALAVLKESSVDAVMDASFNSSRAEFGIYPMQDGKLDASKRTNRQTYYLYTLKGKEPSFTDSIFAVTRGYSIIANLQAKGVSEDRLIETTGSAASLSMLYAKRIDAIADLAVNIEPLLIDFKNTIRIEPELKTKEYFLIYSMEFYKLKESTARKIWDKISALRDSNFGTSLIKKYNKG